MKFTKTLSLDQEVCKALARKPGKASAAVNETFRILYAEPNGTNETQLEQWRTFLVVRVNAIVMEQERRAKAHAQLEAASTQEMREKAGE